MPSGEASHTAWGLGQAGLLLTWAVAIHAFLELSFPLDKKLAVPGSDL